MKDFGEYLHSKVEISCIDGQKIRGEAMSFGGSVQGEEEYGRAEDYICIYPGDSCYVIFRSEIKDIVEL